MDGATQGAFIIVNVKGESMEWRLTATTLFCKEVQKWVPIMVYREGKTTCGFFRRQEAHKSNGQLLPCAGPPGCSLCTAYREDVFGRNGQKVKEKEWPDEKRLPA
jgi:hypothetical protein